MRPQSHPCNVARTVPTLSHTLERISAQNLLARDVLRFHVPETVVGLCSPCIMRAPSIRSGTERKSCAAGSGVRKRTGCQREVDFRRSVNGARHISSGGVTMGLFNNEV